MLNGTNCYAINLRRLCWFMYMSRPTAKSNKLRNRNNIYHIMGDSVCKLVCTPSVVQCNSCENTVHGRIQSWKVHLQPYPIWSTVVSVLSNKERLLIEDERGRKSMRRDNMMCGGIRPIASTDYSQCQQTSFSSCPSLGTGNCRIGSERGLTERTTKL